jgi:hypothetical protein
VIHRIPALAGSIALTALLQTAPVAAQDYVPNSLPAPPPALDADLARQASLHEPVFRSREPSVRN